MAKKTRKATGKVGIRATSDNLEKAAIARINDASALINERRDGEAAYMASFAAFTMAQAVLAKLREG